MRKVTINITIKAIVNLEEGETVENFVQEMDYDINYCPDNAENRVIDSEIIDYTVIDSK